MNFEEISSEKSRNSSIELLRIVAMFFIIMAHLSGHGVMNVRDYTTNAHIWDGGTLFNKIYTIFLLPGGGICVG